MPFGISTACFYPDVVENAIDALAEAQIPTVEIFFNTASEITMPYMKQIKRTVDAAGVHVVSLHPYTSEFEPFLFFSNYPRRLQDALDLYEHYFEVMQMLGSKIMVFHGDRLAGKLPPNEYAERFCMLAERGRKYGVTVAHENVARCRMGHLDFIRTLRPLLGEYAAFVLDCKQALRAGEDPFEMLSAMGTDMVHLHLSDSRIVGDNIEEDCLPPGTGNFDMERLFSILQQQQYNGCVMIELYRKNYDTPDDLYRSYQFLCEKYSDFIK